MIFLEIFCDEKMKHIFNFSLDSKWLLVEFPYACV